MTRGQLLVSLDVELGFGSRGELDRGAAERVRRGRELVLQLLEWLERAELPVTWAVTMGLLHRNLDAARDFVSQALGHGVADQVWGGARAYATAPELYFHPEFGEALARSPRQELACHGYVHTVWNEAPGAAAALERELRLARHMAERLGRPLETLVFPQNRYSGLALEVASRAGFVGFRRDDYVSGVEPRAGLRQALGRARRFALAFAPGAVPSAQARREAGLWALPGQRFLRFDDPASLRRVHLGKVRRELDLAAQRGGTYHLWTHPENLTAPGALLVLTELFETALELRDRGRLHISTMAGACRIAADAARPSHLRDAP